MTAHSQSSTVLWWPSHRRARTRSPHPRGAPALHPAVGPIYHIDDISRDEPFTVKGVVFMRKDEIARRVLSAP